LLRINRSQAPPSSLPYQHSLEFATLYTMQYRMPRNAELVRGFQQRQVVGRRLWHDARAQLIRNSSWP
jgi:hypothetical protein